MSAKANDYYPRFIDLFDALPLSQGGLAKWMLLKNTKITRESISRKCRGKVGITPKDVSLLNLLKILDEEGFDLNSVEFADDGELIQLLKKPVN